MTVPAKFCHRFVIWICHNETVEKKKGTSVSLNLRTSGVQAKRKFSMRILVIEDNHRLSSSLASKKDNT